VEAITSDFKIACMDYLGEYIPEQKKAIVYLFGPWKGDEHDIRYITGIILHEVIEGLIYELIGHFASEWIVIEINMRRVSGLICRLIFSGLANNLG